MQRRIGGRCVAVVVRPSVRGLATFNASSPLLAAVARAKGYTSPLWFEARDFPEVDVAAIAVGPPTLVCERGRIVLLNKEDVAATGGLRHAPEPPWHACYPTGKRLEGPAACAAAEMAARRGLQSKLWVGQSQAATYIKVRAAEPLVLPVTREARRYNANQVPHSVVAASVWYANGGTRIANPVIEAAARAHMERHQFQLPVYVGAKAASHAAGAHCLGAPPASCSTSVCGPSSTSTTLSAATRCSAASAAPGTIRYPSCSRAAWKFRPTAPRGGGSRRMARGPPTTGSPRLV